jgi:glycerol-3-phosphate O-acyltransferase/dihydroxyacetone phosphate acyltransferase
MVAERVMKRRFIAMLANSLGSFTLYRVWDHARLGSGTIFAPDISGNPRLIRGRGTNFEQEAEVGGYLMVVVAGQCVLRAEISEIRGPEELYLKSRFPKRGEATYKSNCWSGSKGDVLVDLADVLRHSTYSLAPKREGNSILKAAGAMFGADKAICLFPEGSSHDRPNLLPLKCKNASESFKGAVDSYS